MNATRPILMVIDDEPEVLRSVHDLFRMDYRVWTFGHPEEAIERLAAVDVPVVLCDQRMPEMSGVELLARARDLRPNTTRLLFTGYTDVKAVIDAINKGHIYRYITKPWDPEELAGIVRQAVEMHDLIASRRALLEELQESNARLREADRIKSAFIEVASHELNTPVAVVLGLSELWKMTLAETATAQERTWVERMQAAGKRLAAIVERMLKLLQADRFAQTLDLRPTDLGALVRGVAADLGPFLEARHQAVELQVPPGIGSAEIDPEKVADVLTNLLANAIKFTPDDQMIRVAVEPAGPDWVRFAVADPGIGIGPEDRRHLFEPFFTGYDTMHHSSGQFQFGKRGIGLGLHLVKTFVELHGGRLEEVCSAPGQGSTFGFLLPRRPIVLREARTGS